MRILFFILLLIAACTLPWWVLIPLSIVYAFLYNAYELIVLGLFLDITFGTPLTYLPVPILYTIGGAAIVGILMLMKPLLSFHETVR